jgi:hypothetical protein
MIEPTSNLLTTLETVIKSSFILEKSGKELLEIRILSANYTHS